MASTGGRYSVITKGPLTGAIACSNSGGYFGAELQFAGWDMIIFEGRSPKPVYLHVENDKAQLLPADDLWGKSIWDTEAILKKKHQDPLIRVSASGAPARAQVLFAARRQRPAPRRRPLGRRRGDGLEEPEGDRGARHEGCRRRQGSGGLHEGHDGGEEGARRQRGDGAGPAEVRHAGADERDQRDRRAAHAQPPRRAVREGRQDLGRGDAREARRPTARPNLVTNQACFGCTIACGRISKIDETHFTVVNKPEVLGRLRRPRVRGGVGARRRHRRRRPRGADLRQLRLQRGRHRPDLVRRDGRRGDGALRPRPHQGSRRRLPAHVRLGRGADASSPR